MRWIVLAILLAIVPYTWITLHYRKAARPFEPYNDLKQRANVHRLLAAGYHRIPLSAERPADRVLASPAAQANPGPASGGIPAALKETLVEVPNLPESIRTVHAPTACSALLPYTIDVECTLSDLNLGLASSYLYLKDKELVLLNGFETFAGTLRARSRETTLRLTAAAGAIPPGDYRVTVVGLRNSLSWSLSVK